MKKTRIAFIVLLVLTSGLLLCAVQHKAPEKSEKRTAIMQLLVSCIQSLHFKPIPVNDSLSDRIYKLYIKRTNNDKLFFTQKDIDQFKPYEFKLDSEITQGTFVFYDLVNHVFQQRLGEDSMYAREILSKPFDFTVKEEEQTDYEKLSYPKNTAELHERWRKVIKLEVLTRLAEMLDAQEKGIKKYDSAYDMAGITGGGVYLLDERKKEAIANAILDMSSRTGKKDTSFHVKTYAELEKEARAKTLKTYEYYFREFAQVSEEERLAGFFDAIANSFDPHTEYFSPPERNNFDISMSGKLEGIGAQLRDKSGSITIEAVVPGSPAWKSGELKEGDVFLKVAQGDGDAVDIEGMPLNKAVQLIRGKKGTVVKLTVKSGNTTKVVSLVRDVIPLEETFAHASVINSNGQKLGYIRLPEFYTDFDGKGGRRCSEDVKILVKELEDEKVKGIIIDLRDNGGGSLPDVIKMAGLFVPQGPIVQTLNRNGKLKVGYGEDTAVFYKGPLMVMVNGASASASEIFAAAMQDYKRAVIIGTQTYGKGTVQSIYPLDQPAYADMGLMGSVKVTIQKFYRINGHTTQKDGVVPDVPMPDANQYYYEIESEKTSDYPLESDRIKPAKYDDWYYPADIGTLAYLSANRITNDSVFNLIREEAKAIRNERDSTIYSLNLVDFRKGEKKRIDASRRFNAINRPLPFESVVVLDGPNMHSKDSAVDKNVLFATAQTASGYSGYSGNYKVLFSATSAEQKGMMADSNEARTEKLWLKRLTRDPELYEATRIMGDMKQ